MATVLVLAPGSAVAAAPRTHLRDLGAGYDVRANGRGDIVGYSAGAGGYVLWPYDTYAPVDLGDDVVGVGDINRRAHVVGRLSDGAAFLWRGGALTRLEHPAGSPVWATAVNDRDEVAGLRAVDDWAPDRPLVWRNGVAEDFPTWHGLSAGEAVDINNSGTVLVNLYAADRSEEHALLWSHGVVVDLGSLGGSRTRGIAINDGGTVLGWSENAAGQEHPFRWQRGTMTDLAPAGGTVDVQALNQAGDVAGQVDGHPAWWRRGALPDILDGRSGAATSINDRGDIAGITFDPAGSDVVHTPFRRRNGNVVSFGLLFPGLVGTWVNAVDDRGRVIGTSSAEGGGSHVVVWTTD